MSTIFLTWLGHAAFLAEAAGITILLDPFRAPDVGSYAPIHARADVVLVSHLNPKYHSHWDAADSGAIRLNALDFADDPQGVTAHGVTFKAVRVWETPERSVPVAMPYFTLGDLRFCHMGDLGHALSEQEAAPVQNCDVLLAVAGGLPTVPVPELKAAIDLIGPRIVVPMHYQTGKVNLPLLSAEPLAALFAPECVVRHPAPTITLSRETLPTQTTLFILPPAL